MTCLEYPLRINVTSVNFHQRSPPRGNKKNKLRIYHYVNEMSPSPSKKSQLLGPLDLNNVPDFLPGQVVKGKREGERGGRRRREGCPGI
jgi:hypothetical protein